MIKSTQRWIYESTLIKCYVARCTTLYFIRCREKQVMLVEQRNFTLCGSQQGNACVRVNPTGKLEVKITDDNSSCEAEFSQLWFNKAGMKTLLVCREEEQVCWQLDLSNQDAKELECLIESAQEEFEILMRAL